MKFLSTWLRNLKLLHVTDETTTSSMKFLSTWLRNVIPWFPLVLRQCLLNEVPEHMAQESQRRTSKTIQ